LTDYTAADLQEWGAIARQIGWGAADILMQMQTTYQLQSNEDGPVTTADVAANDYILSNLQAAFGQEFGYLSEETFKTQPPEERLNKSLVWVIDKRLHQSQWRICGSHRISSQPSTDFGDRGSSRC